MSAPAAPPPRALEPGGWSRISVAEVGDGPGPLQVEVVHQSDTTLFEAPNWSADGRLILNGDGGLWQLEPHAGAVPRRIELAGIPDLNNDHVLDPDCEHIYLSANDWQIYRAPLAGGEARRVTADDGGRLHFLHGVSPDGSRLAYVGLTPVGDDWWAAANIYTVSVDGADERQLTEGTAPADGPEYTPDGAWLYFNTEAFSSARGHAQVARMRTDGSQLEQLTFDERVNWFPHIAPTGDLAVYLSFPPGTIGHPADLPVQLKLVRGGDWAAAEVVLEVFGGQGTINVNSWAPDGRRFAFVDYSSHREGTP